MLFDAPLTEGRPLLPRLLEGGFMEELNEVAALRAEFPEWQIEPKWATSNSGPDGRVLIAWRDGVSPLVAMDADGLRRLIHGA